MKRTRATALVLVNWRGVFYERYLLDPNVTALEGANGSGKTTVLIAAYLVLLPDMTRLRFTSVAEHAGTGGDRGVWGRLGQPGRPSYVVMDMRLPNGERLLAGVHLERRSEPTVEPTEFLITGLADNAALQHVLLERGDVDSVPELSQLRDQVARLGGRLHTYSTAKEYFAALFDYGVTPLRLATDEERSKLNEMLRTSMMGGISRALTTDLREFLLKEETGLADTLKRMRANLDACRRTRTEVEESRRLEQEISAVYEAGQEMFAAAVHATRERAQELKGRVSDAKDAVRQAEHSLSELSGQFEEAKINHDQVSRRLASVKESLESAQEYLRRLEQARAVSGRIRDREASLVQASSVFEEVTTSHAFAARRRDVALRNRDESQLARERAAEGLADFTRGLEELEHRAAEHQLVSVRFAHAKTFYADLDPQPEPVGQAIDNVERMRLGADSEFISLDQSLSTIEERRNEYRQVLVALQALHKEPVLADRPFEHAREALAELRRLEIEVRQAEQLPTEIDRAKALAERQRRAREIAVHIATRERPLGSQQEVERALAASELELQMLGDQHRREERIVEDAEHVLQREHERITMLDVAARQWKEIEAAARSLETDWECAIRTRYDVLTLRVRIVEQRDNKKSALAESETRRADLHEQALGLEQAGGTFSPELLKIRDVVEGELLAGHFEEIDADDAPAVQALLGPLADAIIVDDPRSAFAGIAKTSERPDSVWLVGGDAALNLDEQGRPTGEILDRNVLVPSGNIGWRVTRFPDQPTLGRRARERRVAELREEETTSALEVDQHKTVLRQLDASLSSMDQLLTGADVLERGDPSPELEAAHQIALDAARTIDQHRGLRDNVEAKIEELRPIHQALRDLLPLAWLLDESDYHAKAEELRIRLEAAKTGRTTLEEARPHRLLLEEKLDILRRPPPSDAEVAELRARRHEVEKQQATLTRVLLSLRYVNEHWVALSWTDAEAALHQRTELAPALKEQLELAKKAAEAAEQGFKDAEQALQSATSALNNADIRVKSLEESLNRDREEWASLGVEDASDAVVAAATASISGHEAEIARLEIQQRQLSKQRDQLELLQSQASDRLADARKHLEEEERAWKPDQERWQRLQTASEDHGILAATLTRRFMEVFSGQGSPNLRQRAREQATALKERLARAHDVEQVRSAVEGLLGPQELSGETYLQAWLEVRNWLRRRMPAQIAEIDEPLEALGRLREHLTALEIRLRRQETELRGESEDIARNIDIHIRRAQKQVNRLTFDLEQVRFGSIQGVRLQLQRVERMDQVLSALREGQAQELLFKPDMPIEEALEEIFRRFAGGRTGGQKLLDYREYLDPKVTVKRKGSEEWEVVNANRLSTGEGIGIGAAVMMVVLAAWERDANLLRAKRSHGTLRLLFLDEANRLDKENLGVLFDLCQNLELQLVVAAPEVARAEGNTTYRLVRRVGSDGHEEVIVTGRRAVVGVPA